MSLPVRPEVHGNRLASSPDVTIKPLKVVRCLKSMAGMTPGLCPFCGTTNPPGFNFCAQCHHALPGAASASPAAPPPPQDAFQLVTAQRTGAGTTINVGRGAAGLFFVYIGLPLLLIGIMLLVVAGLVAQGAASFNQACSTNPLCTPAPDPSGGFAAGGVLILLIGIGLVAYGFSQYRDQ